MSSDTTKPTGTKARGFASLSPERRKEIASLGGKSVAPEKRSFSKNRQLAQSAGTKGGKAVPDAKRSFSRDRDIAVSAGRLGGVAAHKDKRDA